MSEPSSHKHTSIFNSHAQQSELLLYKFDQVIGSSFLFVKKQTAVDLRRL